MQQPISARSRAQVRYHAAPLLLNIMPTESAVFQVIAGKRKLDGVVPLPLKRPHKARLIFEINHPEPRYRASAAPKSEANHEADSAANREDALRLLIQKKIMARMRFEQVPLTNCSA